MRIEQADPSDTLRARECHEVYLAAQRDDEPGAPWFTDRAYAGWLAVGWDGNPREVWQARREDGPVAGWYWLELPSRENLDRANLVLIVHPAERRRGTGRALLRHAAGRAVANGRSVLSGAARQGSPGEAFARAAGAVPGLADIQRVLDVATLDRAKRTRLRGPAERAAAGYSLVSWAGPVPEEFTEGVAAIYNAMGDAPHDPGSAAEKWDAQRVREQVNDLLPRFGMHHYAVAARHDDTGALAAMTEVAVDPEDPGWGHQVITAVTREHRGHRLGLLLKLALMDLLETTEPQMERMETMNAASNAYMVAVNDALGYVPYGAPFVSWQLDPAAGPGPAG